jgi:hypothetical protein
MDEMDAMGAQDAIERLKELRRDLMHELGNRAYRAYSPRGAWDEAKIFVANLIKDLQEKHPEVVEEQKHLDEGTDARAYWHYGYVVGFADALIYLERRGE